MRPETACWEGGGLNKGRKASASTSVFKQTVPPALKLRASESFIKFVPRTFKKNTWNSGHPVSHLATISAGFHSQML